MFNKIMRNLNIRMKFVVIYAHMAFWAILFIIVSFITIDMLMNDSVNSDKILLYFIIFTGLYFVAYVSCTIFMGTALKQQIVFPLRQAVKNVEKIGKGNLNVKFDKKTEKDEVSQLIDALRKMAEALQVETDVIIRIAEGDYTEKISLRDEEDSVYKSIKDLQELNRKFLSQIKDAVVQISTEASHIADGAQNLASGSSEQASTIEEFSASIMEIKQKADENAEIAQGTLKNIDESTHLMQVNIEEIKKFNIFIEELTKDSRQIAKVIKVIDDIAFQTNILALNAAVEAARAGQHGKGFAVVADEVRELASKSAKAAKETSDLIRKSLDSVNEGSILVEKTNAGIEQMGKAALENQTRMKKLSEVSIEQGKAITEIDKGVTQISDVVQSNSSMAEESAAAAEQMSAQTDYLNKLISRFKTDNNYERHDEVDGIGTHESNDDYDLRNPSAQEKAKLMDFFPDVATDSADVENNHRGFEMVDVIGPEIEDFSKLEVHDKY